MPRFYLHICNGTGFTEDEEGSELPDLKAARAKAIEGLREVMAADLMDGELNTASFVEIEDEARDLLLTVQFLEVVEIKTAPPTRKR